MLRDIGGHNVWMTTISAGRPGEVQHMTDLLGPISWYVPESQHDDYKGAAKLPADSFRLGTKNPSRVSEVRNRMLQDAFYLGVPCIQFDDDLKRVMRLPAPNTKGTWETHPVAVQALLAEFVDTVMQSPYKLGGVPPTNNHFFANGQLRSRVFCRSHLWMVKPNKLRLDTNMQTKFDYDYTIQHVQQYGGVCRCDNMIWDFDFGGKSGGHVDTRTHLGEIKSVEYLQRKWGTDIVRKNPRRAGEVLLKFPKQVRTVLT
jgi:hypothetical protein